MEPEHHEEWFKLQKRAGEILRNGFSDEPMDRLVLRVLVMPSFAPWSSWELYERESRQEFIGAFLTKRTWQMHNDLEKFRSPVNRLQHPQKLAPTITISTWEVDESFLVDVVEELCGLQVPVHPGASPLSVDGTSYELTTVLHSMTSEYRWHENAPQNWRTLQEWTLRWTKRFDEVSQIQPQKSSA